MLRESAEKGLQPKATRLRTDFAIRELNLRRVCNGAAYSNVGSRRANQKAASRQQGLARSVWHADRLFDIWLGDALQRDWQEGRRERA